VSRSLRQFRASFSTTKSVFDSNPPEGGHTGEIQPEDVEAIVRRAKQTFRDTLPKDYLTEEEYKVYLRLYGPPLRETAPEDVGIPFSADSAGLVTEGRKHTLLRETEDGTLEEVDYELQRPNLVDAAPDAEQEAVEESAASETDPQIEGRPGYIDIVARNEREYNALLKLQKDFELASQRAAQVEEDIEEPEEEEQEDIEEEEDDTGTEPDARFLLREQYLNDRVHPHSHAGRYKTNPSTLQLPKEELVRPITELLRRTDMTHLAEAALKTFGGAGLPYSPASPRSRNNIPQKGVALEAGFPRMSEIDADSYLAAVFPGVCASVTGILVEVRKRLGSDWLRDLIFRADGRGPRILDAGGAGAGLLAWNEVFHAEWLALRDSHQVSGEGPARAGKAENTVIVGSNRLRHRVSSLLHDTTFLPRLPHYLETVANQERNLDAHPNPQPRKKYDVIIAPHLLLPLEKEYQRRDLLDNLWEMLNPDGGVLIMLEKAHPRGFEAVADARQRILDEFIVPPHQTTASPMTESIEPEDRRVREPGMIIAPCTNHAKCPMYLTPGISHGRKDFCHFSQRFIRPPFLQKILGAKHFNHEDIEFSYVAVRRGVRPSPVVASSGSDLASGTTEPFAQGKEAADLAFKGFEHSERTPHPLSLPRSVLPPLKRHGHVILDVCTPAGKIERWTVPRSFSRQAYHDARKAKWGDLWALGAKTRTPRNVRLGRAVDPTVVLDGGVRAQRALEQAKGKKQRVIDVEVGDAGGIKLSEQKRGRGYQVPERRTKGGKKAKARDLMRELEEAEQEEEREEMRELEEMERSVMEDIKKLGGVRKRP